MFWKLFTLEQAFLSGDHREQQYPWASFYQEQIREGHLPWWTTRIHSGFPILAEGQIGAFYPINFLTFYFLPKKIAYNYGILLHYFLAAVFFYAFSQTLKRSKLASVFATAIFLYGSTQGGYFYYNYISQKVVIWLPLTLVLIENIFKRKRWQTSYLLGVLFAIEIFGGYLQVAIYTLLYTALYFFLRWLRNAAKKESLWLFLMACILGMLLSLVQLLPTFELALFSSRAGAPKAIAYIGSMNPFGLLTLFYPSWDGFLASECYVGVLGVFFFLWSFKRIKDETANPFFVLAGLFLLLALGEWSPLYRLIIETTGFSSFRTPIKFLFFVTFSLSVLTAYGWDEFWAQANGWRNAQPTRWFFALVFIAILSPLVVNCTLYYSKPRLLPWLENFVVNKFHNQPGHPHSADEYRLKTRSFYSAVQNQVGVFKDKNTRIEWILLFIALFLIQVCRNERLSRGVSQFVFIAFLLLDLYFYSFTSIRPNFESFATIDNHNYESELVSNLRRDQSVYRVTELFTPESQEKGLPVYPSLNMIYGFDDLGAYSPLVMKSYKQFLQEWGGYINDSLSTTTVTSEKMLGHINRLKILNTKYVLSREPLLNPSLHEDMKDNGVWLYRVASYLPRSFFSFDLPNSIDEVSLGEGATVDIEEYHQQHVLLKISTQHKGFLLISDIAYPGWKAYVDGLEVPVQTWAGLFRAVPVTPGMHSVSFKYEPVLFKYAQYLTLFISCCGFLMLGMEKLLRRTPL